MQLTTSDIRGISVFVDAPDDDAKWLTSVIEVRTFEAGDEPFEVDAPANQMMIVFSGAIEFHIRQGERWSIFGTWRTGSLTGRLPYSRMEIFPGKTIVIEPTLLGFLHMKHFRELLYRLPNSGQRLVEQLSDRVKFSTQRDQEQEKMMALGRLSAGLAHELNNPAAAVQSAADALQKRFRDLAGIVSELASLSLTPDQLSRAMPSLSECEWPIILSTLERGKREDELTQWLEERGIDEAWKLAPNLVDCGITLANLEETASLVPNESIPQIIHWIEMQLSARSLVDDIKASSAKISELIGSVQSYSHMDRDPSKQVVDIVEGIESTLTMLGHKIRKQDIQVQRHYATDCPPVSVFPGEINQVWTNLIDNAIDALQVRGTLTLSTSLSEDSVLVRVEDNGSGIPLEVHSRVFEPFFTTKSVGDGTGLGLDIAKRIVEEKHGGTLAFESHPGRTVFSVALPLVRSNQ